MAVCKFCRKDIVWMKEGRKNVPVNGDGSVHRCEEMQKTLKSIRQIDINTLSQEEIQKYEEGINKRSKK